MESSSLVFDQIWDFMSTNRLDEAKELAQSIPEDHPEYPEIQHHYSHFYEIDGQYEEAIVFSEKALNKYEDPYTKLLFLATLVSSANYAAKFDIQDKYVKQVQEILATLPQIDDMVKFNEIRNRMILHNNMGQIAWWANDMPWLKRELDQAYRCAEMIDHKKFRGRLANNLAMYYDMLGEFEDALKYYHTSATIKQEINDRVTLSRTLMNIASLYFERGYYEEAEGYYNRGLDNLRQMGLHNFQFIIALYFYQNFLLETNRLDQVETITKEAVDMAEEIKNTKFPGLLYLGLLDAKMKQVEQLKASATDLPQEVEELIATLFQEAEELVHKIKVTPTEQEEHSHRNILLAEAMILLRKPRAMHKITAQVKLRELYDNFSEEFRKESIYLQKIISRYFIRSLLYELANLREDEATKEMKMVVDNLRTVVYEGNDYRGQLDLELFEANLKVIKGDFNGAEEKLDSARKHCDVNKLHQVCYDLVENESSKIRDRFHTIELLFNKNQDYSSKNTINDVMSYVDNLMTLM